LVMKEAPKMAIDTKRARVRLSLDSTLSLKDE